jgi:hypothetical protein
MLKLTIITLLISITNGFIPNVKPSVKSFKYFGDIKPIGYFDPFRLTSNLNDKDIKYVRESELQHGRVSMLAFVGLTSLDLIQDKSSINFLFELPWISQSPFWFGVGTFEISRMIAGWTNPFINKNMFFKLKKQYQPGNVFKIDPNNITETMYNKELSNGRLAMLGTIGYIVQDMVT